MVCKITAERGGSESKSIVKDIGTGQSTTRTTLSFISGNEIDSGKLQFVTFMSVMRSI